jgi:hypothetical protein
MLSKRYDGWCQEDLCLSEKKFSLMVFFPQFSGENQQKIFFFRHIVNALQVNYDKNF